MGLNKEKTMKESSLSNYWSKTDRGGGVDSCWNWLAYKNIRGYGVIRFNGKNEQAHRVSYREFFGDIEKGFELDHRCKNTSCVNPYHLEAVSHRENVLRGNSPAALHAKKIACYKGHQFSKENTWFFDGGRRRCRICTLERNRKYEKRRIRWKK